MFTGNLEDASLVVRKQQAEQSMLQNAKRRRKLFSNEVSMENKVDDQAAAARAELRRLDAAVHEIMAR